MNPSRAVRSPPPKERRQSSRSQRNVPRRVPGFLVGPIRPMHTEETQSARSRRDAITMATKPEQAEESRSSCTVENNSPEIADSSYTPWSETSEINYGVHMSLSSSYQSSVNNGRLKKKCIFPYSVEKWKAKQRVPLLGHKSPLQSSIVSRRSELQGSSTHQTKSVQKTDRILELVSYESNSTNNFSFVFPSKRNRPVSAPPGQLRSQHFSSSKFHSGQKASESLHIFKRQPQRLRVTAYKNGTLNVFAKVTVPLSIKLLLEMCTEKLKLNMAARRVFLADGTEVLDAVDIPHDADVYISTGEPFSNPFRKIKDHLLLMKDASWTLNGIVFPRDVKRGKTKAVLFKHAEKLVEKPTIRLLVFKNGIGQDGFAIPALLNDTEKFLDRCTIQLKLSSPAKYLYSIRGEKIEDLINVPLLDKCLQNSITPLRGPLWVSKGEGFSPSGAKMYIQGVLLALHQRLKAAKNYCEQENKLIEDLRKTVKRYKEHLSKLAPQLQAEQEQSASYVYQHIKELPANTVLSQGLQLKVFENGKDTEEVVVYISKKEMESGCGNSPDAILERVQYLIHQRLQHSADFKPSGLSQFPTRLFDKTGQEIKNPLLLQNEQK
uniref:KHA domain-containing protein n=1 Tax=Salvator merianae TaxID=96440 RepID=A0A8D0B7L4_SALMN